MTLKDQIDDYAKRPFYGEVQGEKVGGSGIWRVEGRLTYPTIHDKPYIAVHRMNGTNNGQTAYIPFDRVLRIEEKEAGSDGN